MTDGRLGVLGGRRGAIWDKKHVVRNVYFVPKSASVLWLATSVPSATMVVQLPILLML